jgi:hypothetical protein
MGQAAAGDGRPPKQEFLEGEQPVRRGGSPRAARFRSQVSALLPPVSGLRFQLSGLLLPPSSFLLHPFLPDTALPGVGDRAIKHL